MSSIPVNDQLQHILELSQQMLVAAQNEDWEQLNILEQERQANLPKLALNELSSAQQSSIREVIEDILNINQTILTTCTSHQDNYRENNRKYAVGKQAVSAYDSV